MTTTKKTTIKVFVFREIVFTKLRDEQLSTERFQ